MRGKGRPPLVIDTDGIAVHDAVDWRRLDPAVLAFGAHRLKIGRRHTDSRGKLAEDPAAHSVAITTDVDVPRVRRLLGRVLPINSDSGGR